MLRFSCFLKSLLSFNISSEFLTLSGQNFEIRERRNGNARGYFFILGFPPKEYPRIEARERRGKNAVVSRGNSQ